MRGLVQGVGFRPTVWRLARECRLDGDVRNDGSGVLIRISGAEGAIDRFCGRLIDECPPLARIDAVERADIPEGLDSTDFRILASDAGDVHTGVVADAATCAACIADSCDPANRRYRYPFTNCTHCGPRLSIVRGIPYDRANTSMSAFAMCPDCLREYEDPADRRFHAQPNACPRCGPKVWLEGTDGTRITTEDPIAEASARLAQGQILAIKGIGGYHLACDACNAAAVACLRQRKRRYDKPFALMARDIDIIGQHAEVDEQSAVLLTSSAAPIVLMPRKDKTSIAAQVAPGQATLGFMLPYTPLHHLLMASWERPLIMTSGNLSEEPQCIENVDAVARLADIADTFVLNDRDIVNRLDDSVVRVVGGVPRTLRRARGYAPTPMLLPDGFARTAAVCALGGELKNTFCLLQDGHAIVSQHLGDLQNAATASEQVRTLELYRDLYQHRPSAVAVDLHPDYHSTRLGQQLAAQDGVPLETVQHHHAHIASVLGDNGQPLNAEPVIGVALDGLGLGDDDTIWGGEFLLADYRDYRRLARLAPVPLPGGEKAILEPWRSLVGHLMTYVGWQDFERRFANLDLTRWLRHKPVDLIGTMIERRLNSPLSSSCGRLFDAIAAALDLCRDRIGYEGQAAIELETLAAEVYADEAAAGYPFGWSDSDGVASLSPAPMWRDLLQDLARNLPRARIAARFHAGLAHAIADTAVGLATQSGCGAVALSGGVFQNKTLLESVDARLSVAGLRVLTHREVPTNDGGLAYGQALVAAARCIGTADSPDSGKQLSNPGAK